LMRPFMRFRRLMANYITAAAAYAAARRQG
jgi:hypothetical protein